MEKRVLVTGVSGFAGRYVVPCMAGKGYVVSGVSTRTLTSPIDGVTNLHVADLRDPQQMESLVRDVNPTHVVHLAAISFVDHKDVQELYLTNIVGTRNLLSALTKLSKPPEAVLLTSSANVYGLNDKGTLEETDPLNPANDYAVSKIAMEFMSRQFSAKFPIIIARPFNYTGVGQSDKFLIPKIVNHFRRREAFIELGNTDVFRDFSDVRAVAIYLSNLMESKAAAGEIYNICSGTPYSLNEIIEMCTKHTGHEIEIRVNPDFVRANDVRKLIGSTKKLLGVAGKDYSIPLDETLAWMLSDTTPM